MKAGYIVNIFPYESSPGKFKELKCFIFILIHDKYGPMLFDTGSPVNADTTLQALHDQFGLKPEDITWAFNTHLHIDHVGLNRYLTRANIVMSRNEFEIIRETVMTALSDRDFYAYIMAKNPGARGHLTREQCGKFKEEILKYGSELDYADRLRARFIEDNPALPDCVRPYPSFGHTYNHYSFQISLPEIDIHVVGDSIHSRMSLFDIENETPEDWQADQELYFRSRMEITRKTGLIVAGHDRPFISGSLRGVKRRVFDTKEIAEKYAEEQTPLQVNRF